MRHGFADHSAVRVSWFRGTVRGTHAAEAAVDQAVAVLHTALHTR
ncbi:hypothetical protein ACFQ9U_00745 [Streptomyces sp. NPDC056568]